jgi:hypothetical protein
MMVKVDGDIQLDLIDGTIYLSFMEKKDKLIKK